MSSMNGASRPHAVEIAVQFVAAQTGGAARILTEHHRRKNGYCGGCVAIPTRWPCTAASIARAALADDDTATAGQDPRTSSATG